MEINDDDHVSRRWFNVESVPKSHVFSDEDRPGNQQIPLCNTIPIIDLENNSSNLSETIIQACQEYGFFQVINHGVSEDVISEAMKVMEEIFNMPVEEIKKEVSNYSSGWVYMGSTSFAAKGAHLWRDNLKHPCHPLDECMHRWPRNPPRYRYIIFIHSFIHFQLSDRTKSFWCRDVVGAYIKEIRRLSLVILELISEGLGLEEGYLGGISQVQFLTASNYPVCPDPTLTLGLLNHFDHSLITILYQGNVEGLQFLKDGKWIGVEAIPNAFLVNIGTQIEVIYEIPSRFEQSIVSRCFVQIISNGKLRSAAHRVVTNQEAARTTIATFINPSPDCIIQPAKLLIDEDNPPIYQPLSFRDFVNVSKPFGPFTDALQNGVCTLKK
ncbi:PREDICTED: hyoscyamine 6-dioxygenase-like [Erythranthe guttata]|uniref:hyoscyamine 6-dioxygenase-like n=1 Tax=Erythranthe guttata TaxID=4155 RepID=UPI00064DC6C0|nr:PREDICTED: hyoscyamine 6-dioxygenase-like [Erythranthe guttata]|eukprot:XP_012835897.1 PREDICTED: hyoscyamine 6-dioxygenase-like [Erythranthe guttata]